MKKITKKWLMLDDHLEFNIKNKFAITKYFNKEDYPNLSEPFDLYIDYTMEPSPNTVTVILTYLNPKTKSEGVEEFNLELKNKNAIGKKQIPIRVATTNGNYQLWKVAFVVTGKDKTILNLSA